MRTKLLAVWTVRLLLAASLAIPGYSAETPSVGSAAAPDPSPAALTRRLEDLQQEMARLQSELAEVKKQLTGATASSAGATAVPLAAPAAPAASPAPAAVPASLGPVAPAPQAATGVVGFLSSISMSGTVDGYYGYNFNHPHVSSTPSPTLVGPGFGTGLRAFDGRNEQIGLNLFELNFDKAVDPKNPLGFHLALGYGDAMNVVNATDPGTFLFAQYLKEAYFSYLAPVGKGLQVDFGKFVTTNGAEVIETKDNWNYSRGLLFTFAIPFYHFGLRAKYPINDKVSITGLLVNGWNNIVDNNTGKTYGVSLSANPTKKISLTQNYYVGPEQFNTNSNWRQLTDTVVTYNPTGKLSLMTNFDYGREKPCNFISLTNPCPGANATNNPAAWWSGIAQYARYAFNDATAVALRYEYLNDHNNYAFNGFGSTGRGQHVQEGTVTLERVLAKHLITRLEYRGDVSNLRPFTKGTRLCGPAISPSFACFKSQSTATVGLIYVFDTSKP